MAGRADPDISVKRWLRLRIRIILRFTVIPKIERDAFFLSPYFRVNNEGIQGK
jgi:hypothetical protein